MSVVGQGGVKVRAGKPATHTLHTVICYIDKRVDVSWKQLTATAQCIQERGLANGRADPNEEIYAKMIK